MCLGNHVLHRYFQTVCNLRSFRMLLKMKKIFDIPLRSFDRRKRKMTWFHENTHGIIAHFLNNLLMNSRISYHTFLTDFLSSGFKLWFNQAYNLALICKKISYRKQNFCKRDKGNINR